MENIKRDPRIQQLAERLRDVTLTQEQIDELIKQLQRCRYVHNPDDYNPHDIMNEIIPRTPGVEGKRITDRELAEILDNFDQFKW